MSILPFTETTFDVAGLKLAAKRWGAPGGIPVLAVHGWLDNAGSFDFLAPLLLGCDIVCVDCAGHGASGHRGHLGAYHLWQDVAELFYIADSLQWERFALLRHSRGAMISFLAAATFPERVTHLVLIEGGCPRVATAEQAPRLLAESIRSVRIAMSRRRQLYATFAAAVAARVNGMFPVESQDGEALARRGVSETDNGYFWSYDARLLASPETRLSAEQVEAFRREITARTLVMGGHEGLLAQEAQARRWLDLSPHWQQCWLPGGHHLHMSTQCDAVAAAVRDHLATP